MHAAQEQRVVGDKQVRAPRHCLLGDGGDWVDGEEHPAHLRLGVPRNQSDDVPRLRPPRVVELLEDDDVGEARCAGHVVHRAFNTSAIRGTTTAGV